MHSRINLIVIRSVDLNRAESFYQNLGLTFVRHRHGSGPEHMASESAGFVFEVYPRSNDRDSTSHVRLGFVVDDIDAIIQRLREASVEVVTAPYESPWGRRAVVKDHDGHTVELTSKV